MTRARKWLFAIGAAVGVLIAALVLALAWLVYTPSGLRFALDRGAAMTHGQFAYAGASGTLAGEATLTDLRYRDARGDTLHIERAVVDLQPWALLGRSLRVRKARIHGIALNLAPSKSSSGAGGLSLKPPLTIALDDTLLTRISVSKNNQPVFAADSLAIAGRWSSRQLVLRQLALRAPNGSVELQGTLALAHGYRGRGGVKIDWTRAGIRYVGEITAQSDGRTAQLRTTFSAPVRSSLNATLKLDNSRAWTLALHAPTFDARRLPALPAAIKTLALTLRGTGDARGGTLTGTLTANGHRVLIDPARFRLDGKTLTLDPLRLRSPSMPGIVTATGVVHLGASPLTAALDAKWDGVQLPADLVGQPLATHGVAHITGSAEHFALTGALAIGPPGKLSNLQVDLTGTPQAVQLNTLKLVQKDGGLEAHGSIGLRPHITWKLAATANKFDPGAILAGWNGAMNFSLATQGGFTSQGPRATLQLDRVSGTLRGRSIAGSKADLKIAPDNLLDGSAILVTGHSRVRAVGQPGDRTNAVIDLDVASLGDWLPDAAGKLRGRFTVKGVWPKLAVAGHLNGTGLRMGARRVDKLLLTASIPDISRPGGDLDLTLAGVHASGLAFDSVRMKGGGSAAAHHLSVSATGKPLSLTLALQGSWNTGSKKWTGTLRDVVLSPQGMPAWRQQQASTISWQKGAASISRFCLAAGTPQLCLSGQRDAHGAISADYFLQHLPLQMLATLASGPDPFKASGDISGTGQVTLDANGAFTGHAMLTTSAGRIAFASTADQPLLAWTGITAEATASGGNQHLTLRGTLADGGHINGSVDVRGKARALTGNIDADLRNLAFLSALSPEIADVKGSLTGNLQLGGTLSAPQFSGRIQTRGFSAEVPRAGLKLHDGAFAITGDPQGRLAITGQVTSGKGVLRVDGSTGLSADAPLTLNIKGDNVLVADIPAAHVLASPDLHIARADDVFTLTGSVTIPSADVAVEKLPGQGPAKASPDVVIVDAPPAAQVAPLALDADIEVKLGDDVHVKGYGFDGRAHGQLAVRVRPGRTATGRGQISVTGKYEAHGQHLTIEHGRLLFAGTRLDDPGLDIRAERKIRSEDVTVGLSIRGTAQRPVLTVFSDPAMEQAEALSYLVTGRPLNALQSGEGDTLNIAAQALGGLAGDRLAKSIGSRLGLEAGVSSSEALGGSAFTAGKYLSPRLFLSYGIGLFTPGQVVTLRYTLNRFLQFEAENATTGNRASFNYRIEK